MVELFGAPITIRRPETFLTCTASRYALGLSKASNSNCSEGQIRTYKVTRGRIMTLTQQWRHLNLTRNNCYILFLAKGVVKDKQISSVRLSVRLKGTFLLASRALLNTGEKIK